MKANNFFSLPLPRQLRWIHFEGEFITSIRFYKYKVNLYQVNNFLVEIFYDPKADRIEKVGDFEKAGKRAKFYADQVKLPVEINKLTSQ